MAPLNARFDAFARSVRRRLTLRLTLVGASFGVGLAAVACALAWWLGAGPERALSLGSVVLGAGIGASVGFRRRWSDRDVARYLDARLSSDELVTTAIGLRDRAKPLTSAEERVVAAASELLQGRSRADARPRITARMLWLAPFGLAALGGALWAPTRSLASPAAPGTDIVQSDDVPGLELVRRLEALDAADPEMAEALARAAERSRRLEEALAKGVQRREALARLAEIRDDIQSARLDGSRPADRAGLDAAKEALRRAPRLSGARSALDSGDLVEFDRQMRQEANRAERADRDAARDALEDAATRAADRGAHAVARVLEESRKLLSRREKDAERLRELANALGDSLSEEARAALEQMDRTGSPEATAALSRALEEALESMSEAERQALAEALKNAAAHARDGQPLSAEELRQLAHRLSTPEGRRRLSETLRRVARGEPLSDAERERALGAAEEGLGEAERALSGDPLPVPGRGSPEDNPLPSEGAPGTTGTPGSGGDEGRGSHDGTTASALGETLRARAQATFDPRGATFGATQGRVAPSGDDVAGASPSESTGAAEHPDELRGIGRSELPEAYREQVRRYFEP